MIRIERNDETISAEGHAGFSPGFDPVCEAVTCMVQTLIASIYQLTDERPFYELNKGHFKMDIKNLHGDAQLLVDSFYIGAQMLSGAYPEHIQATRHGSR